MAKTKLNEEQLLTLAKLDVITGMYNGLKSGYESARAEAKASKDKYDKLSGEVEDLIAEIEEEQDENSRQALRAELAKKRKELDELETETAAKQAKKLQFKTSIDQSIEEMKSLPGVREAIQERVQKKYEKEIRRLGKEEEKETTEKEGFEKIQELTDEDLTDNAQEIADNFKDMLDARNELKIAQAKLNEIETKLATETDPSKITDLNQQQVDATAEKTAAMMKYQTAKTNFMTLSKNADPDFEFEEGDIDKLVNTLNAGMKRRKGKENEYSIDKVLKKQISKNDKSIKSLQAQRAEYEQGKAEVEQERAQIQGGQRQTKIEQAIEQKQQALQEEEKLHWWNFIKRHRRTKQLKQYEQELIERQEREEQQPNNDKAHKLFVKELQKNATIESIINKEMRGTIDRVADAKRNIEENDR